MTTSHIPDDDHFSALCREIGLAVLMSQKVQFALSYYYGLAIARTKDWKRADVKKSIASHLSKPMGSVVKSIREEAPLPPPLATKVREFLKSRNWLVHKFDEEATPELSRNLKFDDYTKRMQAISAAALDIMQDLDAVGRQLVPNAA
jgi:hypothetical protein